MSGAARTSEPEVLGNSDPLALHGVVEEREALRVLHVNVDVALVDHEPQEV